MLQDSKSDKKLRLLRAFKHLFAFAFVSTVLMSCDVSQQAKPGYTGTSGELVVVAPTQFWKNGLEDSVNNVFATAFPYLPQSEPRYTLFWYSPDNFESILRRHRNVLYINVNDTVQSPSAKLYKEKWAKDQLLMWLNGESVQDIYALLKERGTALVGQLAKKERDRKIAFFSNVPNKEVTQLLADNFGVHLNVPDDYEIGFKKEDFLWVTAKKYRKLSGVSHDIISNVVVYRKPYNSDSAFTKATLLADRAEFMKNVPGPSEGTYVTVQSGIEPGYRLQRFKGAYAAEIRGLWRTTESFMGGPFVSLSVLNEKKGEIITVEGFVYAPKFDKREYLREMEAILYSLKFL